jgi:hypothetical protein
MNCVQRWWYGLKPTWQRVVGVGSVLLFLLVVQYLGSIL